MFNIKLFVIANTCLFYLLHVDSVDVVVNILVNSVAFIFYRVLKVTNSDCVFYYLSRAYLTCIRGYTERDILHLYTTAPPYQG